MVVSPGAAAACVLVTFRESSLQLWLRAGAGIWKIRGDDHTVQKVSAFIRLVGAISAGSEGLQKDWPSVGEQATTRSGKSCLNEHLGA